VVDTDGSGMGSTLLEPISFLIGSWSALAANLTTSAALDSVSAPITSNLSLTGKMCIGVMVGLVAMRERLIARTDMNTPSRISTLTRNSEDGRVELVERSETNGKNRARNVAQTWIGTLVSAAPAT